MTIPESAFINRLLTINPKLGEKSAKAYYMKLWDLFLVARTAKKYDLRKGMVANAKARKKDIDSQIAAHNENLRIMYADDPNGAEKLAEINKINPA